jgi:hypothetical protein
MTEIRQFRTSAWRDDLPNGDQRFEILIGLGGRDGELRELRARERQPGPRLTTRLTGLPRASRLPACGFWLRILPLARTERV